MIGALAMLAAATPVPPVTTLNERPPFGRSIATSAAEPGAPRLTGIVTTPNGPIASLKDSASGLASWVSVGGSFAGWTFESASDDLRSAVLRRDGKTITVSLPKPGAQPNAAPYVAPSVFTRQEQPQPKPTSPPPPEETIPRQRLRVPQR
jgi:hypothetical protein